MIHPYEWADYRLIVMMRTRSVTKSFLIRGMSQVDFMEHWMEMWEDVRDAQLIEMTVSPITDDVFDMLVPAYDADRVLEG